MGEAMTIIEDIYFGIRRWFVDEGMGRIHGPFYKRSEAEVLLSKLEEQEATYGSG